MVQNEKFGHYAAYGTTSNVGEIRHRDFSKLSKVLISVILAVELFCIIRFWPY